MLIVKGVPLEVGATTIGAVEDVTVREEVVKEEVVMGRTGRTEVVSASSGGKTVGLMDLISVVGSTVVLTVYRSSSAQAWTISSSLTGVSPVVTPTRVGNTGVKRPVVSSSSSTTGGGRAAI